LHPVKALDGARKCPHCKRNAAEKALGRRADRLTKDQSVGILRVLELTKFPSPERSLPFLTEG